ncbi:hypothetical protein EMIT0P74_110004 [Pseudomonas sp. IT-P74]
MRAAWIKPKPFLPIHGIVFSLLDVFERRLLADYRLPKYS